MISLSVDLLGADTDERELLGVNTPDDLATVEAIIRAEQKNN